MSPDTTSVTNLPKAITNVGEEKTESRSSGIQLELFRNIWAWKKVILLSCAGIIIFWGFVLMLLMIGTLSNQLQSTMAQNSQILAEIHEVLQENRNLNERILQLEKERHQLMEEKMMQNAAYERENFYLQHQIQQKESTWKDYVWNGALTTGLIFVGNYLTGGSISIGLGIGGAIGGAIGTGSGKVVAGLLN